MKGMLLITATKAENQRIKKKTHKHKKICRKQFRNPLEKYWQPERCLLMLNTDLFEDLYTSSARRDYFGSTAVILSGWCPSALSAVSQCLREVSGNWTTRPVESPIGKVKFS